MNNAKRMYDDVEYTSSQSQGGTVSRSTWQAMRLLAMADENGCKLDQKSVGALRLQVLRNLRKAICAVEGGGNECLRDNLSAALVIAEVLR